MRYALLLVTGLIGWLWFATREPDSPAAPAPTHARSANLGDLHSQVAAAKHQIHSPIAAPLVDGIEPVAETVAESDEIEPIEVTPIDDEARDGDLSRLIAQLEVAAGRNVEEITVNNVEVIGDQIIVTLDSPSLANIPMAIPNHTFRIVLEGESEPTHNIPGRTFGGVLGAAAGSQPQEYGDGEGVTISSGGLIENTYIVEDNPSPELSKDDLEEKILEQKIVIED